MKPIKQHHALRHRILAEAAHKETVNPKDLAKKLGATLGTVSYHVRTLHDAGYLRLVKERKVRGAIGHDYAITECAVEEEIVRLTTERNAITESLRALRMRLR